jgi:hypothetical protein
MILKCNAKHSYISQSPNFLITTEINSKSSFISFDGKKIKRNVYIKCNEGIDMIDPTKHVNCDTINMDKLQKLDHYSRNVNKPCFLFGRNKRRSNNTTHKLIAWIPSPEKKEQIKRTEWNEFVEILDKGRNVKPNVLRGFQNNGIAQHYQCHGYRKDPKGTTIQPYTFVDGTDIVCQNEIHNEINKMICRFEIITKDFFEQVSLMENFDEVKQRWNIPTMTSDGYCTQFSIGYNYWSSVHTDKDYMYSTIVCFCNDVSDNQQIIYHFCFPDFGICIPMCNGTIIVFDPTIRHCCSNPMVKNAYIMSCYVSEKTVNTQVSHECKNTLFVQQHDGNE